MGAVAVVVLFVIGLLVSSLVAVPLGLGFAGSFTLILTCSVVLSLAPSISSGAGARSG